jgi:hypothetical protein
MSHPKPPHNEAEIVGIQEISMKITVDFFILGSFST